MFRHVILRCQVSGVGYQVSVNKAGRMPEDVSACHSERSEESRHLRTAEILRRPDQIGTPQDDKRMVFSPSSSKGRTPAC
jgi:hypothetical protein